MKGSMDRNASAVEKLQQSEASGNAAIGMQHQIELVQRKVANLEMLLHIEGGIALEVPTTKKPFKAARTRDCGCLRLK